MDEKNTREHLEAKETLGTPSQKDDDDTVVRYIGVTLNYSPKFKFSINIGKRRHSCDWGCLTPDQQRDIFVDHIKEIYILHFDEVKYAFELTKDGQLHCHFLGIIHQCNPNHKDFDLACIRKSVAQHPEVLRYTKGKRGYIITSNYIHYVEKDKWLEYITKDLNKTPYQLNTILTYKGAR